jgi:Zn-dependent M28 family amino/carboxypeptidase
MPKIINFFLLILILTSSCSTNSSETTETFEFNHNLSFNHLQKQVLFGPRIPGSEAHENTAAYIIGELKNTGWKTEIHEFTVNDHYGKNLIGKWGTGEPWLILGAHYDTRLISDRELSPNNRLTPVPGANDGASGVAVLLELARVLPGILEENLHQNQKFENSGFQNVWLVFFDLEDNGDIPGYDWILGSTEFVKTLENTPSAVVILDMIGDSNLKIYIESNSDYDLSEEIWEQASNLGYSEQFIPKVKYSIIDDHTPFLENGIKAVDIIDFEYAHWHTTQDTIDKVSPESLKVVGDTILAWILNKRFN